MKRITSILTATLISVSVFAQTGELTGYVKDKKTGDPLPGASILLENTSLGTITNLNGFFRIPNVPTQSYNVQASFVGFQTLTKYNVIVRSAGNVDLNFDLEETVETLEGVTITANPFDKLDETPLSIQRLGYEEIISYPGGNNDVAKVIQSLPGVATSLGGFRNDVIIRGGGPNEVVYYLDGIEIPNINHFATQGSGGGPLSLLNVSFFEGVTLTSSAFGAKYDNVLSGVLQFDQRNGNDRERRTNIRVSGSEAAITTEGPLFKGDNEFSNSSYIFSVRRSYLQLLFKLLDLPFLPDYWDYQLKIDHKLSDRDDITLIGIGSIDDFSINVPEDLTPEGQAQLDDAPVITQWSNTNGISWRRKFRSGKGFMRTSLSHNILNNNLKQFDDNQNETGLFFENDSRESETKLRYEITRFSNDWIISGGLSFQNVDYVNSTFNRTQNFSFESDIDFVKYGFFGQVSKPIFGGRITPSFGFRMDGNSFTDNGNSIGETFSPRLSVSAKLDNKGRWLFNASAGRYFKIPPGTILGFQGAAGSFVNRDSEYIRSDHLVAGFEYLPRTSTRITLEGFYKRYANYPVSVVNGVSLANLGGDFEVFGNEDVESVGLGRTYGLEFLVQQKLTGNLFAILAYTYYKSEYTGFDESIYLPSLWDYNNLISFTGGYKLGKNWELGLKFRLSGEAPFAPVDVAATTPVYPDLVLDYSQLGDQRLESFTTMDLRIDKKWNFPNWSLNVYFDFQNLYAADLPQPPVYILERDGNGNITVPRQLRQLGDDDIADGQVLPTFGFVIDF